MYKDIAKQKFNELQKNIDKQDIYILSIESSCDDTSIAVVKNGKEILSNIISSQIDIHKRFGGVVPEVASRNHLMAIDTVLDNALSAAGITLKDIDAVAVTYGAGLLGALLVGVSYAKALAYALEVPLIKVNHIKGHISANYLSSDLKPPYMCLVVSGGHTALLKIKSYTDYDLIGSTIDDAVGECYDKVAKVLGLEYPGGPKIDKLAKSGKKNTDFVKKPVLNNNFNFSYSGLKTAVINYVHTKSQKHEDICIADVCTSFQTEAVNQLVDKTMRALKKYRIKKLAIAGGVSANEHLRNTLKNMCDQNNIQFYCPPFILCTDNAAMIGAEGYIQLKYGKEPAYLDLKAESGIHLKKDVKR